MRRECDGAIASGGKRKKERVAGTLVAGRVR